MTHHRDQLSTYLYDMNEHIYVHSETWHDLASAARDSALCAKVARAARITVSAVPRKISIAQRHTAALQVNCVNYERLLVQCQLTFYNLPFRWQKQGTSGTTKLLLSSEQNHCATRAHFARRFSASSSIPQRSALNEPKRSAGDPECNAALLKSHSLIAGSHTRMWSNERADARTVGAL